MKESINYCCVKEIVNNIQSKGVETNEWIYKKSVERTI